ncbi:NAD(P)H-hydrate dehydratase [Ramlibacter sp. RBP-2]|uniref:Bifunctional NAD(P)H-hydrate repair enzyme n=1 Tax=Ramlibacter lithotrophicus TaxID=2606681 RepID=A0A7X6DD64_9BURK|nr:NAD(P)H-hydrate dehydratase [Ramlibacter lithotrophicus]NKE64948.1 NAD(P)H-hydrate dehydratase [Ramlibacter lithotrophicus]
MDRIRPHRAWPLFDTAASRAIERASAGHLPPHALMQRAGLAVARLALALAPHARTIWLACGPGNNGGDGFEAAMHLRSWGKNAIVTWSGDEGRLPQDARASLQRARAADVRVAPHPPAEWDLAVDAMLGLGAARPLEATLAQWATLMAADARPVLAVDLPSGLDADTGGGHPARASHTLALLTLKPGLFTAGGRDAAGEIWFDDLGIAEPAARPTAWLAGAPPEVVRLHASHKGSYGDVAVVGGAAGMGGAALLAATAALHGGAGRVFACLLDPVAAGFDSAEPALMLRRWDSLDLSAMAVACGCGGGDAVRAALPTVLATARALVLDADALNAIAADTQLESLLKARARRARPTVLTPHPLEAGRLLGCTAAEVQADRLGAGRELVQRLGCVVVLKGSGTVIAGPGRTPLLNPTGNARLASAGTGDVLAGLVASHLAAMPDGFDAAAAAVYEHGRLADHWPRRQALTASALARAVAPERGWPAPL